MNKVDHSWYPNSSCLAAQLTSPHVLSHLREYRLAITPCAAARTRIWILCHTYLIGASAASCEKRPYDESPDLVATKFCVVMVVPTTSEALSHSQNFPWGSMPPDKTELSAHGLRRAARAAPIPTRLKMYAPLFLNLWIRPCCSPFFRLSYKSY